MTSSLYDLLNEITGELPGCLHTSVIDRETGLSLASVSQGDPLETAGADAFHSDLFRTTGVLLEGLPLGNEADSLVLSSQRATFVSVPLAEMNYLWLVVTERRMTVGFTQALMRKHQGRLETSVRELLQ
ncbi:hypothetical protein DL240_04270 [Lujinxingia litoralis]|uniref:Roadblock/LAMTOR2 domain-containing protein n=1 Tax=Lujinxingia litoralis TaxID=2211119 RepID=A0A328CB70_9DELT|nr:hypothetical protein [Lujinxingia litoralis]RAL25432.1 hypothetical protein DL240_04270 [Lujinxingia litoralis]